VIATSFWGRRISLERQPDHRQLCRLRRPFQKKNWGGDCNKSSVFLRIKSTVLFAAEFRQERLMVLLFIETAVASTRPLLPLYQIPLTLQFARGNTALMSAVCLLPLVFLLVFAFILSGTLLPNLLLYVLVRLGRSIHAHRFSIHVNRKS
jgi:hypothetical protein